VSRSLALRSGAPFALLRASILLGGEHGQSHWARWQGPIGPACFAAGGTNQQSFPLPSCVGGVGAGMVSSVNVPEDLRYSTDHEWVRQEGGRARVGITDYAQSALGDVVFVQLPEVGTVTSAGQAVAELESTKSVSDVYAPLAGTVVEVNSELADMPQRVNEDPYGEGWICVIEPTSLEGLDAMMGAAEYRNLVEA